MTEFIRNIPCVQQTVVIGSASGAQNEIKHSVPPASLHAWGEGSLLGGESGSWTEATEAVRKARIPLVDPRGAGEGRPCEAHPCVVSEAALPIILRVGWTFGPLNCKISPADKRSIDHYRRELKEHPAYGQCTLEHSRRPCSFIDHGEEWILTLRRLALVSDAVGSHPQPGVAR